MSKKSAMTATPAAAPPSATSPAPGTTANPGPVASPPAVAKGKTTVVVAAPSGPDPFVEFEAALKADLAKPIGSETPAGPLPPTPAAPAASAPAPTGDDAADEDESDAEDEAPPVATDETPPAEDAAANEEPAAELEAGAETESEIAEREAAEAAEAAETAEAAAVGAWPKSAQRRVGKLLHRVETMEAELATLRSAKTEAETKAAAATAAGAPPQGVTQVGRALREEIARNDNWLKLIDENPEGLTVPNEKGEQVSFSADQLRGARRTFERNVLRAEMRLDQHQAAMAAQTAAYTQAAETEHPWLKDKTSEDYQRVQTVLRAYPEVLGFPDHLQVLADCLAWRKLQAAKALANGEPARPANGQPAAVLAARIPKPASRQPARPAAAPAIRTAGAGEFAAKEKKFMESGSIQDGVAVIQHLVEH